MSGLGFDTCADLMSRFSNGLSVVSGMMQVVSAAAATISLGNAVRAAEGTSLAAAYSATGIGLTNVAIATGAMVAAAAVTYTILNYTIRGDLSSPSESQRVAQTIGVLT